MIRRDHHGSHRPGAASRLAAFGDGMRRHARVIRTIQWTMVGVYAVLLVVPALRPPQARILSDLTVAAQFVFWGVWWPFVLVSVILAGRVWCGVFCPEGALSEWASRHGRQRAIPHWVRWRGWPFVAFAGTTVYGQLVSVYQYPGATLVVLGGSTIAAMAVGYLYGRDKRIWCRYLCPVSGVFGLLAKLSPLHFRVDGAAWAAFRPDQALSAPKAVNCAPLMPIRTMTSASGCHMCGRCAGYRNAIALAARSPNREIVALGGVRSAWDSGLLPYGLIGLAMGAFHWSASPWFVGLKQNTATWLVAQGQMWPLTTTAPWWLLTNYPAQNEVFSLLDGALLVAYVLATAAVVGTALSVCIGAAMRALGPADRRVFHHLAQAMTPMAGCGVFLGLSALTVSMLRFEQLPILWIGPARGALLAGAGSWSLWLAWRIARRYAAGGQQLTATIAVGAAIVIAAFGWVLLFWIW